AGMHWLDDAELGDVLNQLQSAGAPDLSAQLALVMISYRVAWCKRKVLQGKRNFIARAALSKLADRAQRFSDQTTNAPD
ncbi:MAG: hypothetical protein AAGH65_12365, partial [Pseudomonadota bacterium]